MLVLQPPPSPHTFQVPPSSSPAALGGNCGAALGLAAKLLLVGLQWVPGAAARDGTDTDSGQRRWRGEEECGSRAVRTEACAWFPGEGLGCC